MEGEEGEVLSHWGVLGCPIRNEKCGMRNELPGRDEGLDSKLEVPVISNFEFQISNSKFWISRVSRKFGERLFLRRG